MCVRGRIQSVELTASGRGRMGIVWTRRGLLAEAGGSEAGADVTGRAAGLTVKAAIVFHWWRRNSEGLEQTQLSRSGNSPREYDGHNPH